MKIGLAHADRLVREAIRRTVQRAQAEFGLQLVWSVADSLEFERMRRREPVELQLLDANLYRAGMQLSEVACLVLSAGEQSVGVFEALSDGALAHVVPPQLEADGELTGANRLLARIGRLKGLVRADRRQMLAPQSMAGGHARTVPFLALGASTGGPNALAKVLSGLPAELPAAVLIVQHIDREFSEGLVEWLGSHSRMPVRLACNGETPECGRVYVAGAQGHLVLLPSRQLGYRAAARDELHVPSVDALFKSLCEYGGRGVAALLSGMGADGAQGLLALRRGGWYTVAQNESSCSVYGMPRAAVELGAALRSLPLEEIAAVLSAQLNTQSARKS
jgi:two-component system response regulator WspF